MGKLIFAGILLALGIAGWRVLSRLAAEQAKAYAANPRREDFSRALGLAAKVSLALGLIVPILIVVLSTFVIVSTGHVGVVTQFAKVEPTPLYEGFNLVAPWKAVHQMDVRIQKKSDKFSAGSKDSQAVFVVMTINYKLRPSAAPEVFRTVGYDYPSTIIAPAELETLKAHTAAYPANEMLLVRAKLKSETQSDLAKWLTKYGLDLVEVSLADIDFEPAYKTAISNAQVEERKAAQKIYEVQQAQRQAEIAAAKALGEANAAREAAKGAADATRATAQADADSLRLRGQAQSEYNAKVAGSLTPALVKQMEIEAWKAGGSRVPQFITGGSSGPGIFFSMPLPTQSAAGK